MSWLSHNNPSLDTQKLEAEIDEEVKRLKNEKKVPEVDPLLEKAFSSLPAAPEDADLLEMMENYTSITVQSPFGQRRRWPAPFNVLVSRILRKIFQHQHVYNLLALEVLKNQEKRIKSVEERLARQNQTPSQ